jgi:hypothetical protein
MRQSTLARRLTVTAILALGAPALQAAILNPDGDFGAQTIGNAVGSPWGPVGGGQTVTLESQSPFTNVYANNGKGTDTPATAGNPYYVGEFIPNQIAAGATGKLYFNVDFRNTSNTQTGDYSITIGRDADGTALTAGLFVTGNSLFAASSVVGGGAGASILTPETGKWYNAQLTLDLTTNTYSGVITREGTLAQTLISPRPFITENNINDVYTDGGTGVVAGAAPSHFLDNWALSTTPLVAATSIPKTIVVNVDFNGRRPGDNGGATYLGQGAGGGGNVFNGVVADSTGGNDNLNVSASNLRDSFGSYTSVGFSFNPVGGDQTSAPNTPPATSTDGNALFGDYVFNDSAGNHGRDLNPDHTSPSDFTIDGLAPNSFVDLWFYRTNGTITIPGETPDGFAFAGGSIFNGGNTIYFQDVPVSALGTITGQLDANTVVLGGFSVRYIIAVPEPASLSLLGLAGLALIRRRK